MYVVQDIRALKHSYVFKRRHPPRRLSLSRTPLRLIPSQLVQLLRLFVSFSNLVFFGTFVSIGTFVPESIGTFVSVLVLLYQYSKSKLTEWKRCLVYEALSY